jgi:hypothetical protein
VEAVVDGELLVAYLLMVIIQVYTGKCFVLLVLAVKLSPLIHSL